MPLQRTDFRFFDRLRVRWAEVDMQKIVFNGHYLMYFDTAIAGYWRALATPYHETMSALQGDMFARKATVEYEASARYDDLCEVGVRCARIGNSSMIFELAVFRGGQRLVHGELVYVFADPVSQTSRPVPAALREVLQGFEAGEPMLHVRTGAWGDVAAGSLALRGAVFGEELAVSAAAAEDDLDAGALHAMAVNRFGLAVGAARLTPDEATGESGSARIGRVCVMGSLRGAGVGHAVVGALLDAARARGKREVVVAAEEGAQRFYQQLGFVGRGPSFVEAGRMHQEMALAL